MDPHINIIMPKCHSIKSSICKLANTLQVEPEQDDYEKLSLGCKEGLRHWEAKTLCSGAVKNYNALLVISKRAFTHMKTT